MNDQSPSDVEESAIQRAIDSARLTREEVNLSFQVGTSFYTIVVSARDSVLSAFEKLQRKLQKKTS